MPRYFNTTGPSNPQMHYMLPPEARLPALLPFVEQHLYFVVHAARQTGKTTAMRAFAERLRGLGYAAVWATLEVSQDVTEVERAEPLWLETLEQAGRGQLGLEGQPPATRGFLKHSVGNRLNLFLRAWSEKLLVPLVLLLDEADVIRGPAMVSFLRQLRAGFVDRGMGKFPISVALIGMRDLRDYLTQARDGTPLNPGSPFNIKSESLTLRNFTEAEVGELYQQHTQDTQQVFTPEAIQRAFYWTRGQPFLVNALARKAVMELAPLPQPVTVEHINEAKEQLILSRTTHLDALGQRLREPRVAAVMQAVLLGDMDIPYDSDDYTYCVDLGLLNPVPGQAEPANPLYREVLVRELTLRRQYNLPAPWWPWKTQEGKLDMPALMDAFLRWWRENAAIVEGNATEGYLEAVPHLTLMAFLQRVVNGGGRIHREYAAGRDALDLVVEYAGERHVLEVKRIPPQRTGPDRTKEKGKMQLIRYLDTLGEEEGWLMIFDQRPGRTWKQRLWKEEVQVQGKRLHLRGA